MIAFGLVACAILMIAGAPIWAAMLVSGAIISIGEIGLPERSVVSLLYISMDSWLLLAVPYFLFAGNLMTSLGLAGRLFSFVESLLGHLRGGLPATGVVACTIFGALSGSSTATVVAVGTMLLPHMISAGYRKDDALGIISVSGTLGQMIPPSIYMILFASMVQMDVTKLFLAGIVPGLVITVFLVVTAVWLNFAGGQKLPPRKPVREMWRHFLVALPALAMPVIVLGGIYAGMFTPTEAAAVAVAYVLVMSAIFERESFSLKKVFGAAESAVVTTSVIFIILGGATAFSNALTYADIPQAFTRYMTSLQVNAHVTMGLILLIFLILGTALDPVPILYITIPIVFPMVETLGYSPTHFAVLTVACMMIAQVTPPVGMSLFALSGVFNVPIGMVMRGSMPYLYALTAALVALWVFPWFSTIFE